MSATARSGPAGPAAPASQAERLPDLQRDPPRQLPVALCVDLGDVSGGMTQSDLSGLQTEALPLLGCPRVPKPIRGPDFDGR